MRPEVIQIETEDKFLLPGLLYRPARSKKAVILLHGNGSSSIFYDKDRNEALATALAKKGISYLAFNNRGANIIKSFYIKKGNKKRKVHGGMAHELIKDCVEDIDAAFRFLEKRGYKEFYLLGLSTGANKVCVYDHYKKRNRVSKYILLGGGDDTGIYYDMLGKKKFFKLLRRARSLRKNRARANDLIPELLPNIFSYKAFYDVADPNGDYNVFPFYEATRRVKLSRKPLFRYFKAIKKPTLVIYGEHDEYAWNDVPRIVDILKEQNPKLDYKVIKGADHSFTGHSKQLARAVSGWL